MPKDYTVASTDRQKKPSMTPGEMGYSAGNIARSQHNPDDTPMPGFPKSMPTGGPKENLRAELPPKVR